MYPLHKTAPRAEKCIEVEHVSFQSNSFDNHELGAIHCFIFPISLSCHSDPEIGLSWVSFPLKEGAWEALGILVMLAKNVKQESSTHTPTRKLQPHVRFPGTVKLAYTWCLYRGGTRSSARLGY